MNIIIDNQQRQLETYFHKCCQHIRGIGTQPSGEIDVMYELAKSMRRPLRRTVQYAVPIHNSTMVTAR